MPEQLNYQTLKSAVEMSAAFRCRTKLQPAGGQGDKVFPPTYAESKYALEKRRLAGYDEPVVCVLMDSVQSQANRFEEALQDAVDEDRVQVPIVEVDFSHIPIVEPGSTESGLYEPIGRLTSLETPHRIADAILRDSELDGVPFRQTEAGKKVSLTTLRNATPLLEINPTALVLGLWDSTGPKGGLGVKFQRALVSEIIGVNASLGVKTESRIDPLAIQRSSGPLYEAKNGGWTLDANEAVKVKSKPKLLGKDGRPSEGNHGNIVPSISKTTSSPFEDNVRIPLAGGVTIDYAEQTTVLSLPALRRLKFPIGESMKHDQQSNSKAQTALAALALCGSVLAAERGMDLRSRCLLWPEELPQWELLGAPGETPRTFSLTSEAVVELLREAVDHLKESGLPWRTEPIRLKPTKKLAELVQKSQALAVESKGENGDDS
ncbi:MAG: type I-U CRISPR-associated protein Cas7 [Phycisphaera sp. RhM]|nr:type I-U CRISPR-associated protein Cas7 [Phycisphaera sp. RhM]